MKQSYLPRTDAKRVIWLQNFAGKLPNFSAKYGITPSELADMAASAVFFSFWHDYTNKVQEYTRSVLAYRDEMRDGTANGASPSVQPVAPALTGIPPAPAPGIFLRARALTRRIKAHAGYTEADGLDLGIVGEEESFDPQNLQPELKLRLVGGGHPEIVWVKKQADAIELYVSRNGGAYTFLAIDTRPNYTDNHPLPAVGTSEVWKYKAIYRLHDAQIGSFSDEVSVTVAGNV